MEKKRISFVPEPSILNASTRRENEGNQSALTPEEGNQSVLTPEIVCPVHGNQPVIIIKNQATCPLCYAEQEQLETK